MKAFAALWWIFGCALIGASVAQYEIKCPNDPDVTSVEVAAAVSIWPAGLFYSINGGGKRPLKCKVNP